MLLISYISPTKISSEGNFSRVKTKPRGDDPNTKDIEYRCYKLGGVVDPRVVDTRLRFRDIARIGRPMK